MRLRCVGQKKGPSQTSVHQRFPHANATRSTSALQFRVRIAKPINFPLSSPQQLRHLTKLTLLELGLCVRLSLKAILYCASVEILSLDIHEACKASTLQKVR